jgi:hypothetical protein
MSSKNVEIHTLPMPMAEAQSPVDIHGQACCYPSLWNIALPWNDVPTSSTSIQTSSEHALFAITVITIKGRRVLKQYLPLIVAIALLLLQMKNNKK